MALVTYQVVPKIRQVIDHYATQSLDNKIINLEEYKYIKKRI